MTKEHNFVSAAVYLHNDEARIGSFLGYLSGLLDAQFEKYEIICVNDASTDGTAETVRAFAREHEFPLTLVQMSAWQGLEPAMNAAIDAAIGDFVFEFDTPERSWPEALPMDCYRKALEGFDIVWACPAKRSRGLRGLFYRVFNRSSDTIYPVREDDFRLVSRRALNRVHAISGVPFYRKAAYAASGLRLACVDFEAVCRPVRHTKDLAGKALDALALYTDMGYRLCVGISLALLTLCLVFGVYTVSVYFGPVHQVTGWTSTMLVMCIGFFGVFLVLTMIIKYLSLLVELLFKKQRYLIEGIEKIQS